jgi:uncharacterized membrane protein
MLLQVITYALVLSNLPVARQIVVFVYLTFIPGFVIFNLLKLEKFSKLETLIFSVGFSVAFLMFAGLLINEFSFLFGISQPLSTLPLIIAINSIILIGGILAYLRSDGIKLLETNTLKVSPLTLSLVILPILTVIGAMWVNVYDSNSILLLALIIISLVFIIGTISTRLPSGFYPVAIFVIAVSLLFHSTLISKNWVSYGSDTPIEYFVFKTTQNNAHWSFGTPVFGRFNSMLSITVLPVIYSNLLNIDATNVIKIIYPLIFAFVPLALYQLWQTYFGKRGAFAAAFLLMAQSTFYMEMLGLNRQMIAELFFVLLLFTLSKRIKGVKKVGCFIIFSFALITAHYGLAEIFLFFVSAAWILLLMRKRINRNINAFMILFTLVIMFFWYVYTSNAATFNDVVQFGNYVYTQLGQFFDLSSRGSSVLQGLGLESAPNIWNAIGRVSAILTEILIIIGFISLMKKRKNGKPEWEYSTFAVIGIVLLILLIVTPGLSKTLNMTRFYHILLFLLAPLCVLGAATFVKLIRKQRTELYTSILLLIVLVPYLLFQTNFVYEVVGVQSSSLPLSKHRTDGMFLRLRMGYFDESEVTGASWLSKNVDVKNSNIYGDRASALILLAGHGMMGYQVEILSNTTVIPAKAIVFLNYANMVEKVCAGPQYVWNTTDISPTLNYANEIYSNGGCEIYVRIFNP